MTDVNCRREGERKDCLFQENLFDSLKSWWSPILFTRLVLQNLLWSFNGFCFENLSLSSWSCRGKKCQTDLSFFAWNVSASWLCILNHNLYTVLSCCASRWFFLLTHSTCVDPQTLSISVLQIKQYNNRRSKEDRRHVSSHCRKIGILYNGWCLETCSIVHSKWRTGEGMFETERDNETGNEIVFG